MVISWENMSEPKEVRFIVFIFKQRKAANTQIWEGGASK